MYIDLYQYPRSIWKYKMKYIFNPSIIQGFTCYHFFLYKREVWYTVKPGLTYHFFFENVCSMLLNYFMGEHALGLASSFVLIHFCFGTRSEYCCLVYYACQVNVSIIRSCYFWFSMFIVCAIDKKYYTYLCFIWFFFMNHKIMYKYWFISYDMHSHTCDIYSCMTMLVYFVLII